MFFIKHILLVITLLILFTSCDKGYDVRFTNFYLEPIDSVHIGSDKVVFINVEVKATTDFSSIKKGNYSVRCRTRSKKIIEGSLEIPSKGTGKRTLQIDGLGTIITLEE